MLQDKFAALMAGERDWLANLANASALIFNELPEINWAGFYLLKNDELVLGPFQGLTACTRIQIGKGVCGTAVKNEKAYIVDDVHEFPGHIACDEASRSEIVLPLRINNELIGVLDVDSPVRGRFGEEDRETLEALLKILVQGADFPAELR